MYCRWANNPETPTTTFTPRLIRGRLLASVHEKAAGRPAADQRKSSGREQHLPGPARRYRANATKGKTVAIGRLGYAQMGLQVGAPEGALPPA